MFVLSTLHWVIRLCLLIPACRQHDENRFSRCLGSVATVRDDSRVTWSLCTTCANAVSVIPSRGGGCPDLLQVAPESRGVLGWMIFGGHSTSPAESDYVSGIAQSATRCSAVSYALSPLKILVKRERMRIQRLPQFFGYPIYLRNA